MIKKPLWASHFSLSTILTLYDSFGKLNRSDHWNHKCPGKMKYQMFHHFTRARHQSATNLTAEANFLNPIRGIYTHERSGLSQGTLLLGICGRLRKKQLISFSHLTSYCECQSHQACPLSSRRGSVPPVAAISSVIWPHISCRAACEFTAHRNRERIFGGWEGEKECCWEARQGRGVGQNWWGTLVLSALPGGPLNKDQLSRTWY